MGPKWIMSAAKEGRKTTRNTGTHQTLPVPILHKTKRLTATI
jgi:hypothetical protein